MYEVLREKLAPELLRYEEMAKEATRTISPTRRVMLLLEWTDRLEEIAHNSVLTYMRRYNNSAAAMPHDLADIDSFFGSSIDTAWRAYLRRLRSQTWVDGCQRVFGLRSPA